MTEDPENQQDNMKTAIQEVIQELMERVLQKVRFDDPFDKETHRARRPLYAALVPDEIFKGSHFERRFVTPFGGVWEKLAAVAANKGVGYGVTGYTITGNIKAGQLRRITQTLNLLEHPPKGQSRVKPDWDKEMAYIRKGKGEPIPVTVVCDVYVEDQKNNRKYAFELKSPFPNSDITKVSKEKVLKLHCMDPSQVDEAYFALPYNPFGTREKYDWSFPSRWFDMKNDKVVLMGNEFWEKVGGIGTYTAFIEAVNEIGREYKEIIYREYLGIEPPPGAFDVEL